MRILGIDPGSRQAGFALVDIIGRKFQLHSSGTLKFDVKLEFFDRLKQISDIAKQLVQTYQPNEIAIESLIYVKSPTALIKLAQARGVMLANFLETHQGKIFEYSPNLVKSSSVGHGHATKESIQKFLQMTFGKTSFQSADESDALAVCLCHCFNRDRLHLIKSSMQKSI